MVVKKSTGKAKGIRQNTKSGASVRENLLAVFTRLGGSAAMADWASKNQNEYYRMYARLAPQQQELSGIDGQQLTVEIVRFGEARK